MLKKWGKIYDPDPEGENATVLLFLIHHFCGNFGMLKESLPIPLLENIMFIFVVLFEIEMGWAPLINYSLDVFAILAANVGVDLQKDGIGISTFPNVFAFKEADYNSDIESVMDCTCSWEVDSLT